MQGFAHKQSLRNAKLYAFSWNEDRKRERGNERMKKREIDKFPSRTINTMNANNSLEKRLKVE